MVTDATAYIGTSNWSGDYFINTAGNYFFFFFLFSYSILLYLIEIKIYEIFRLIDALGIGTVFETIGDQTLDNLRQQLENIFHRDWNSEYSYSLNRSLPFVERQINTIEDNYYLSSARYILA